MEVAKKCTQIQEVCSDIAVSEEVLEIEKKLEADPTNVELWMQKGLALRKQMLFREAIAAYSMGLSFDPFHALLYRHRGHAYINIRRYQEGAADLELSARINPKKLGYLVSFRTCILFNGQLSACTQRI